jgi:hypothetical protein
MIIQGSRYYGQPVLSIPTEPDGQANIAVFGPSPVTTNTFVYYTVHDGDRYDTISAAIYGIPDYWWRIADLNPEVWYPEVLVPGSIIRIPTS